MTCLFEKTVGLAASLMILAACAGQGDFGRDKPGELSFIEDLGKRLVDDGKGVTSAPALPMTDEESQIRVLAANLQQRASLEEGTILDRLARAAEPARDQEGEDYYLALRRIHRESGVSLLNAFGNDVLRDIALVDQFARLSIGVTRADGERLSVVRVAMENDKAAFSDAVDVILRVEDNGKVIDQMVDAMSARLDTYALALEQVAFEVPEQGLLDTIAEAMKMLHVSVKGIREDAARHRAVRGELFGRRSADLAA